MKIKAFAVEEWMNEYEDNARYNIAETCVDSISVDELFAMTGEDKDAFFKEFCARRLTYGHIFGAPEFKKGVASLYRTISSEEIITTHGAAGASHHVFYSLVEPGDRVVSIMPTYQQLYSIPEGFDADVQLLQRLVVPLHLDMSCLGLVAGFHHHLNELRLVKAGIDQHVLTLLYIDTLTDDQISIFS